MKNAIISFLLILNFSMIPGWNVDGIAKKAFCLLLVGLLWLLISELENILKSTF